MNNGIQVSKSTIVEGDTGDDVVILQDKLKVLGYYDSSITGSFDEYTKREVIKFQQDYNLPPNGVVDYETWQLLYNLTMNPVAPLSLDETKPTLKLGSTGDYVVELQTILTKILYFTGSIDGNFGTDTQSAVKEFQTNNRLTPDGIVGRDTWSALEMLYAPLAICGEDDNGTETKTYIVVAGDTLWKIAQKFNTTVDAIKQLNSLTSDVIVTGQTLQIPVSNGIIPPTAIVYQVIAGDTLWKIAGKFNTTVSEIKKLNNLTSDILSIGQQLKIPSNNQTPIYYTVVRGDTLWKIARQFFTNVDTLKQLNNLTSDNLSIGQQLIVG